jgi:predicted permease
MSPYQAAAVAIRLFAICLGIYALRTIPALAIAAEDNSPGFAYTSFLLAISFLCAVALWFFPGIVARKLLPRSEREAPPASADTWLAMGCALIGLYMITYALPALIRDAYVINAAGSYDQTGTAKSWAIYNAIEVAVALWLILGGKGFRRAFWWARNAGTRKDL